MLIRDLGFYKTISVLFFTVYWILFIKSNAPMSMEGLEIILLFRFGLGYCKQEGPIVKKLESSCREFCDPFTLIE